MDNIYNITKNLVNEVGDKEDFNLFVIRLRKTNLTKMAERKATVLAAYQKYGELSKLYKSGIVSRQTLYHYRTNDQVFKQLLDEIDQDLGMQARDTVVSLMRNAESEEVKFKSAKFLAESYYPQTFDAGVRRERYKNTKDILNKLFEQQSGTLIVDPVAERAKQPESGQNPDAMPDNNSYITQAATPTYNPPASEPEDGEPTED